MTNRIAATCSRNDLFAFYGDQFKLPIVGWRDDGRAIVQKPNGTTTLASRARIDGIHRFKRVDVEGSS